MVIDPRCDRKCKHDYAEILTYIVIGYLIGRVSLRRSLAWCTHHLEWLKEYLELKNGIASVSTVSRLLSSIDEEMFCLAFIEWMTELLKTKGMHIAIDGKALRGSAEKIKDGKIPYILNAIDVMTGLVIAQLPILEKENEKVAIPKLLELINIKDCVITIDAMGTTQPIIEAIERGKGHFLLTIKKSNPLTYQEMSELFGKLEKEKEKKEVLNHHSDLEKYMESYNSYQKNEKNRERVEYRTMYTCQNTDSISMVEKIPCIKTIGWLKQIRIPIERNENGDNITPDLEIFLEKGTIRKPKITIGDGLSDDVHLVGIISDIEIKAKKAMEIKRAHWKIENSLHHVLDEVLREDHSSARKSKNNLALIRKFAYNLIKIACINDNTGKGFQEMSDTLADDLNLIANCVFHDIKTIR